MAAVAPPVVFCDTYDTFTLVAYACFSHTFAFLVAELKMMSTFLATFTFRHSAVLAKFM